MESPEGALINLNINLYNSNNSLMLLPLVAVLVLRKSVQQRVLVSFLNYERTTFSYVLVRRISNLLWVNPDQVKQSVNEPLYYFFH